MTTQNNFLQSSLTTNNLATNTAVLEISSLLENEIVVDVGNTVNVTGVITDYDFTLAAQTSSVTVTVDNFPAGGGAVDLVSVGGNAVDVGAGMGGTGTQRVIIDSSQSLGGDGIITDVDFGVGTQTNDLGVNLTSVKGVAIGTGAGPIDASCLRTVLANDTVVDAFLTGGQVETDFFEVRGNAIEVNNGPASTGCMRVCVANDQDALETEELTVISGNWHPFNSDRKFVKYQGSAIVSTAESLTYGSGASSWAAVALRQRILLTPHSTTEVSFTCNLQYDTTTVSTNDYQLIGCWFDDTLTHAQSAYPQSFIGIEGRSSLASSDQWYLTYRIGGAVAAGSAGTFQSNPSDETMQTFKLKISNYGSMRVQCFQMNQATNVYTQVAEIGSSLPLTQSTFVLANAVSTSTGVEVFSELYSYTIKTLNPFSRIGKPVADSIFTASVIAIPSATGVVAFSAIRLNPTSSEQISVHLSKFQILLDSASDECVFGVYKNPILSGALAWNNQGRIQYATVQNTITVTSGAIQDFEYVKAGTNREVYEITYDGEQMSLDLEEDVIVLAVRGITTTSNVFGGFSWWY